jgi:hypothetical protein
MSLFELVRGSATAYRLYDVAYEIDLDRASSLLGDAVTGRPRPGRSEGRAILIPKPPVLASLGSRRVTLASGRTVDAEVTAHLFDFGVCSIRLTIVGPPDADWDRFTAFAVDVDASRELTPAFDDCLRGLLGRIGAALQRPGVADVVEDYVVFRVDELRDAAGTPMSPAALTDEHIVTMLLGERRRLAAAARGELLQHRFSYYEDDLAVITWDNALVVEPRRGDLDIEYVLEFANAQLLELRVYDALLDAEIPSLYDRIEEERKRKLRMPTRRFRGVLTGLQGRVSDITEIVERAENAFKVLDDVYLARIYGAALALFRAGDWRRGIERKLGIARDTYTMLNAEAQHDRSELLEIAIIALILFEIVYGFWH